MVTLIFCPGFKLLIPNPAELPDGLGITLIGSLLVTLKLFAEGNGDGFAFAVALGLADGVGRDFPSTIVTFIFCPGTRF
jgi:hypothetical protein